MGEHVAVIDYGMGNLRSVAKALEHVGDADTRIRVTSDPAVVRSACRVVFPGQGAMGDCMGALARFDLLDAIAESQRDRPFLGICIGFQALFDASEEDGGTPALGLVPGQVQRFENGQHDPDTGARVKVPHMGWNNVVQTREHPLWDGIDDGAHFYFVHSYHVQPADWKVSTGNCDYGVPFCAAAAGDGWFATQFHPEKSAVDGLRLLHNFLRWN
jgi:imidazole glycerol-phosphate synthase subunit HisH